MRKGTVRLMILALCLVLCLGVMPAVAFAADSVVPNVSYTTEAQNQRCKVNYDGVKVFKNADASSTVLTTLAKGTKVTLFEYKTIKETKVTFCGIKYSGGTGYVWKYPEGGHTTGTEAIVNCYLEHCTTYVSHVDFSISAQHNIMSLPCSTATDTGTKVIIKAPTGAKMEGIQLLKNTAGKYWYKVKYTSSGTTYNGYICADTGTTTPKYSVSVSGAVGPSDPWQKGKAKTLEGKITSSVLPLVKVGAFVYTGSDTSAKAITGKWAATTAKTYSIKGTAVDTNCEIGSLPEGLHTFTIEAKVTNNWSADGDNLSTQTKSLELYTKPFTVAVLYTIKYDANGGTGAPGNQTKIKGKTLTLSSTKPTRANASATAYTVTFNANGGSCSTASLTAARTKKFTFKNWNTAADGSGTSYAAGASYTANAAATLYAQWNSSTTTAAITLPTPTRTGYTFKGWASSSTATSGSTGSYTPSGNVTLYAIWKANEYTVSYNPNGGTGAPGNQTKIHGTALTLSSVKPTRANASGGSYTVTFNANGGSCGTSSLTAARTNKYTFSNWNTKADGTGTAYTAGAKYTSNADVTLYAQWNSSTTTAAITLPTATRSGYTFKGWATSSSASSGSTGSYTPAGNVTLYAVWEKIPGTYTVSYNANGGTGAPASQTKTEGVNLTLSSAKPTRANASATGYTVTFNANGGSCGTATLTAARTTKYTFNNWNTAANGSGTSYAPGASYTANASVTLYAQWNSSTTTSAITLPTATRSGYTFKGWATSSTAASGSTGSYTPAGNVTLYAVWEKMPGTYTVSYNANGGTGAPASQTKTEGVNLTLSSAKPTRADASATGYTVTFNANGGSCGTATLTAARTTKYTFNNWNTAANGSGTSYAPGASYTANASVTLYAQWNSSTTTSAITLPTATRSGYTFKGWATSSTAASGSTGSYTPAGNVTLYAVWKENISVPSITGEPEDVTVAAGKRATFTVVASGEDLTYQWYVQLKGSEGWDPISSATEAELSFVTDESQSGRRYRCEVKNTNGKAVSAEVTLTVVTKPVITTQPASVKTASGKKVTFKVKATGIGLKYQWYYLKPNTSKWVKISNGTKATYSFTAKASKNGWKFRCAVTNIAGKTNTKAAKLTVK